MKRMSFLKIFGLILALVMLSLPRPVTSQEPTTAADESDGYKVVGYFVQWGMYARNYRVKNVHENGSAEKLTHINYAFANVSTKSRCYMETRAGWGDSYADYEVPYNEAQSVDGVADDPLQPVKGHFNQLKKLKQMYPHLKVMLSLGGWTWSGRFSDAAMPENRVEFVKSCIDLFIRGHLPIWAFVSGGTPSDTAQNSRAFGIFDGIDIDWEFPGVPAFPGDPSRNIPPHVYRPEDTENFVALIAEFRKQLDEVGKEKGKQYLLTIAAPPDEGRYSKMALDKVHQHLDFINIMAYDIHGAWDATGPTNFQAPLYLSPDDPAPKEKQVSVDMAVNGYLELGIPPKKIVVGVPFYGRGWTNVPDENNGLYQSDPDMEPASAKWEAGIEDYKILKELDYPSFRDPHTKSFWIYDGKTFWNYDDPEVLAEKMAYIKSKGLGGTMFWSLDGDDGTLISAIHEGLNK